MHLLGPPVAATGHASNQPTFLQKLQMLAKCTCVLVVLPSCAACMSKLHHGTVPGRHCHTPTCQDWTRCVPAVHKTSGRKKRLPDCEMQHRQHQKKRMFHVWEAHTTVAQAPVHASRCLSPNPCQTTTSAAFQSICADTTHTDHFSTGLSQH
jgi:hypothetical protein